MTKLLALLLFFALLYVSCSKGNGPVEPTPPSQTSLKVDSNSLNLSGNKNFVDSFSIQYEGAWTIAINPSNAAWLKTNVTSGSGNAKVYVFVQQDNTSGTARTAAITVTPNADPTKASNITVNQSIFVQLSSILWSKTFGGTKGESMTCVIKTADRGYIGVATTTSNDGDVSSSKGNADVWVIKIDSNGTKMWDKSFGGSNADYGRAIAESKDGGYFISAETQSNDGDVTGFKGFFDLWMLKIDASGNLLWQRTAGGSGAEHCTGQSILASADGGCVVTASTGSNDGDVSGNHGDEDAWVVKLNGDGSIAWQKTFGGTGFDYGNSIAITSDGGYVVAGGTYSNNGDVVGNHDGSGNTNDAWIIRLDSVGNKLWQRTFGGSGFDQANYVLPNSDGSLLIACSSNSLNGDVTGNHGGSLNDAWIAKIDVNANILWQKSIGGTSNDEPFYITQTTEGYVFAGRTESNDGDVNGNHGNADAWIVELNAQGQFIWQKTFGGTNNEQAAAVFPTSDGNYIFGGGTGSTDGDVSGNHGESDGWLVKFKIQ